MSVFVFPQVPKTPTYGHWGGPGHSGFEIDQNTGRPARDASDKLIIADGKTPIDDLDWCFYRHDVVYQDYLDGRATRQDILEADMKLIYEMTCLDPASPGYPKSLYGQAYIPTAIKLFEIKLLYDLGSIDDLNETEKKDLFDTLKQEYPIDVDIPEIPFVDPASIPESPDYPGYPEELCEPSDPGLPDWLAPWVDILGAGLERTFTDVANALRRLSMRNPDDPVMEGLPDMIAPWIDLFDISQSFNGFGLSGGDPLILDLDRDGVETTSLTSGAYFDHDSNGFAEQTGWAGSDDGLLVMDRDGDGIIEDGTELFGDQTILQNGQKATDGFQALAEFDGNSDGIIDVNDAVWNQLKVWQDIDGDGYSSADELYGLDELSIKSINTGHTSSTFIDANGNEHREIGSFTWNDDTTSSMADVWFKEDKAYTIANEWLDVPETIVALPDLRGYGNVYDLHQAMVRDASGQLQSLVEQFALATTVQGREDLVNQIIFEWTGCASVDPTSRGEWMDARKLVALERFFGREWTHMTGVSNPGNGHEWYIEASYKGMYELCYAGLMSQTHLKDLINGITYSWNEDLQAIRGNLDTVIDEIQTLLSSDPVAGRTLLGEFSRTVRGLHGEDNLNFLHFKNTFITLNEEYGWIIEAAGKTQIMGTSYNDQLYAPLYSEALFGGDGNDVIMGSAGNNVLFGGSGDDSITDQGAGDSDYLYGGQGNDFLSGGHGNDTYYFRTGDGQDRIQEINPDSDDVNTIQFGPGISRSDLQFTRKGFDLEISITNNADTITINQWYNSCGKIDLIQFDDGTIWTQDDIKDRVISIVNGTDEDDSLTGIEINDTLMGGLGNDILMGGYGSDTYIFNPGDGQDRIYEYDSAGADIDTIRFGPGITQDNIVATRVNMDLVVSLSGTTDSITMQDWYYSGNIHKIERFEFADNSLLTGQAMESMAAVRGTDGDDLLYGYETNDKFIGGTGNDTCVVDNAGDVVTESADEGTDLVQSSITYTLGNNIENLTLTGSTAINGTGNELNNIISGNSANNTLTGNDGNDSLSGNAGNDYLTGGTGDDILNGGTGADTMVGGHGDDIYIIDSTGDVITESAGEGTDLIQSSVTYTLGANVENLTLTGSTAINGTGNSLDNILIGNNTANTLTGGAGNDTLNGGAGVDTMVGGAGDDTYIVDNTSDVITENANEGTDTVLSSKTYTLGNNIENLTLTGTSAINATGNTLDNILTGNSAGNTLDGGSGSDTYVFTPGGGSDTITDPGNDDTTQDRVLFGSDVLQDTVALFQSGQNLVIGYGTNDVITVSNQASTSYGIEKIELGNGLYMNNTDISTVIQQITAFAAANGISLTGVNDVKNNQDLMSIVAISWHG